jgi:mandelate racemase
VAGNRAISRDEQEVVGVQIERVETCAVVVPLRRPVKTASGTVDRAPLVLIDLLTTDGVAGRSYVFSYFSWALNALDDLVASLGEMIEGDEVAPMRISEKLRARVMLLGDRGLVGMAISGLDMAAWDAVAQAAGLPLVRLLGGSAVPIPAYDSLGMFGPSEAADAAAESVKAGFRALKIRLGFPRLEEDLASVRAARGAIPDDVELMVDFNQCLSGDEAIRRGRALDGEGVCWIEEPVRADDFANCARVAADVATPVQIGENFNGVFEMQEAVRVNASDLVMPDVQRIGGVTGWLRAAAIAQVAGKPMSNHLFIEASAHLMAVTPTRHWIEYLDLAGSLLEQPVKVVDGAVQAPERSGLGLVWDADAVERHRVDR